MTEIFLTDIIEEKVNQIFTQEEKETFLIMSVIKGHYELLIDSSAM
jgi:hypothetical protein